MVGQQVKREDYGVLAEGSPCERDRATETETETQHSMPCKRGDVSITTATDDDERVRITGVLTYR